MLRTVDEMPGSRTDEIAFGPFRLIVRERLLLRNGGVVELGARTLDTLIALVSRPNEVIGKTELMAHVWPDVTVDEGSLRFQITSLRKALGDGKNGARYITTQAGRGYCFVAPVTALERDDPAPPPNASKKYRLPATTPRPNDRPRR